MIGRCIECGMFAQIIKQLCKKCEMECEEMDFPATRAPFPAHPTTAAPGTPEKLLTLESRRKKHVALFHPFDAKFEGDNTPLWFMFKDTSEQTEILDSIKSTPLTIYFKKIPESC